ncbi:MAG: hypothetical protein ACR2QF_12050 [Geminicoccaceae bacterium]
MFSTKADLKILFENGKLPTGDNFASLIDSMVGEPEFQDHVRAYEAWINRPEVMIGTGKDAWTLALDNHHRLRIAPVSAPPAQAFGDIDLAGYVGMAGRIGTAPTGTTFGAGAPVFDSNALPSIPGGGDWATLIEPPERACIFEIAAAQELEDHGSEGLPIRIMRKLTGWTSIGNATLHAQAMASGEPGRPIVHQSRYPDPRRAWMRLFWHALALLLVFLAIGMFLDTKAGKYALTQLGGDIATIAATAEVDAGKIVEAAEGDPEVAPSTTNPPAQADVVQRATEETPESGEAARTPPSSGPSPETALANVAEDVRKDLETLEQEADKAEKLAAKLLADAPAWITKFLGFETLGRLVAAFSQSSTALGAVVLAWLVRLAIMAIRTGMTAIRLLWRKTGGSRLRGTDVYGLQMRGSKSITHRPVQSAHFYIMKLWG